MIIWDSCGGSGAWSAPYREAGYCVEVYDLTTGTDVRLLRRQRVGVWGILAAPDCTDLAGSGARWWAEKGDGALRDALSLVDACIRIAWVQQPRFWVLENPVGRLSWFLGPPRMAFDPADYGDPYTKRTLLWGHFTPPPMRRVPATEGSKMHRLPPTPDRKALRSVTPAGFAQAFRGQPLMPTASNVLCGCGRFMRVKRNSVTVEELLENGDPYKLWDADLYECADCGMKIITGFSQQPFAEHWQPSYPDKREWFSPIYPGRCR